MSPEITDMEEKDKDWPQILAIIVACQSTVTCGIALAWTSPSIPRMLAEDHPPGITLEKASYFTVLPPLAAVVFSYPVSKMPQLIGQKNSLLFIAIPQLINWILITKGSSLWMYYVARVAVGITDAMMIGLWPVYIAEISSPRVRSSWGTLFTISYFVGSTLVNAVGAYVDIATAAYIYTSLPLLFLLSFALLPESPHHLIKMGKVEDAKEALRWYRRKKDVEVEFVEISKGIERQMTEPGSFADLWRCPCNRRALIICVVTRVTQQVAGFAALISYSRTIFDEAGGNVAPSTSAIIVNAVLLVASIVCTPSVTRFGRRKALLLSGVACSTLLCGMATYLYLKTETYIAPIPWLPLTLMVLILLAFAMGMATIPSLLMGEMFSAGIRGPSVITNNITLAFLQGTVTKVFQVLLSYLGLYAAFYFCAAASAVGTFFCYLVVIETKDKTLEEIQLDLKARSKGNS